MEYPDNSQLYKVARNILFPSPKAGHEHQELVRTPKAKPPPPSSLQASMTRRLTPTANPPTDPKPENSPNPNPIP